MSFSAFREQFQASLDELEGSRERLQRNMAAPPHLVGTLRTTVFTSQLGRVSDLSDPLVFEIIKLYSDLPVLLQIIGALNQHSTDLSKDDGSAQQAQRIRAVLSIVISLSGQLNGFMTRIRGLVATLPGDGPRSSIEKAPPAKLCFRRVNPGRSAVSKGRQIRLSKYLQLNRFSIGPEAASKDLV